MAEILRFQLEGPGPGKILWSDVTKLMAGSERALANAAEARVGRAPMPGRKGKPVEIATHLIFRGIREGSLIAEAELPDVVTSDALELDDMTLGQLAVDDLIEAIKRPRNDTDARVVSALAQLGDDLGIGSRHKSLTVTLLRGKKRKSAKLTPKRHERLSARRESAPSSPHSHDALVGTLYEADFEIRTAHLRTPDGRRVEVTFSDEHADAVKLALREQTELVGNVRFDARTNLVVSVEVERIARAPQFDYLDAAGGRYWTHRSVDALAAEQGVEPLDDLNDLAARDLSDEDAASFLQALAALDA